MRGDVTGGQGLDGRMWECGSDGREERGLMGLHSGTHWSVISGCMELWPVSASQHSGFKI